LIALLLLDSLSSFLYLAKEEPPLWRKVLIAIALLALLVLLTLTKVVMGIAAVALLITYPLIHPALKGHRKKVWLFAAGSLLALFLLAVFLVSLSATDENVFYRFTGTFVHDALRRMGTISHSHLAEALVAPLISPWKGLLFYSPVCVLSLVAWRKNIRRRPELFILPASVLLTALLSQALAYDGEWWTPTWSSRFLLPAIPLLIVASLPVFEELTKSGRTGWIILGSLFSVGFLIQLPAVLFNSAEFTATTYQTGSPAFPEQLIWNLARTPIITQWQAAASQEPDLLLWRTSQIEPGLVLLATGLGLALIVTAGFFLRQSISDGSIDTRNMAGFLAFSAAAIWLLAVAVLNAGTFDPAYQTRELQPLCAFMRDHVKPSEVVIVQPYPGPLWEYLMNTECGQRVWYSLPYNTEATTEPGPNQLAADLAAQKIPAGESYWLIEQTWSDSFQPDTGRAETSNYQLVSENYFYSPFPIFIGSYAPKR
jgi:hypothetical protein